MTQKQICRSYSNEFKRNAVARIQLVSATHRLVKRGKLR